MNPKLQTQCCLRRWVIDVGQQELVCLHLVKTAGCRRQNVGAFKMNCSPEIHQRPTLRVQTVSEQ